ncbi:acetate--CoA ligase family protein [Bacillus sp. ISL-7]|uniref:acetate--CoA ligase family protein n=1 Tax=Bacillus sp. ISL-7 TaxID=2819136 RepID=UPI001BE70495|nr:acetate--CoA ligase family protein [Bacillus sp. ISL-7]MBT2739048.1 acetate--CoA ligase family protein [Bacillus sp. ISL-7]
MKGQNLEVLLRPVQSVAIVGANKRFACRVMMENLMNFGFKGDIFLINPKYDQISGMKCYNTLQEIGKPIDVVVGLVNPYLMMDVTCIAGEMGAKLLVIPGGGYGESGPEGKQIQHSILKEAEKTGMRVFGPNCMGYFNMHNQFTPYIGTLHRPQQPLRKGPVSIVSQSGSVLDAFIASRLGLSRIYSTGNEADLKMSDYVEVLAKDPETSVIILYIEAIRNHEHFLKALDLCSEYRKPVIALKTGKTQKSSAMANAHSGALAGDYKVEKHVLEEHGVIFVSDIDEAVAAAQMLSQPYLPPKNTLSAITVSGGQAGIALDLAEEYGIDFPELSAEIERELQNELPELAPFSNPLDAWGKSNKEFSEVSKTCLEYLAKDPNIGIVSVAIDAPIGQGDHEFSFTGTPAKHLAQLRKNTEKPLVYFAHIHTEFDPRVLSILDKADIPAIQGTRNALAACRALFQYKDFLAKREKAPIYSVNEVTFEEQPILLHDDGGRKLLEDNGFLSPPEQVVVNIDEAIEFSERIGYPVVLKAQGLAHKSDVGGVALNLQNAKELREAWNKMTNLNSPNFLVQTMINDGFETILSYKTDARYGPIVIFGLGGIYTELLKDIVLAVPPITTEKAEKMVQSIEALWKNVNGYRGKQPLDLDALLDAIVKMGNMAEKHYEEIVEFEINPLRIRTKGKGVMALDVLASIKKTSSIQNDILIG